MHPTDATEPDATDSGEPDPGEPDLRPLAARLAQENELLHQRVVEMRELAEEAVARQVELELELQALLNTRMMRGLRPLRVAYGSIRRRLGRGGL